MAELEAKENIKCFVHEEIIHPYYKEEIRQKVCRDLSVEYKFEGNFYCLLHFPENDTHLEKFESIFEERLLEKFYDYRGIHFPSKVDFSDNIFEETIDFSYSTFTKIVRFRSVTFKGTANFQSVRFHKNVFFNSSVFLKNAYFSSAVFEANGDFQSTTFTHYVFFHFVKFNETSQIFFKQTSFQGWTDFYLAEIKGCIRFKGGKKHEVDDGKEIKRITPVFEQNARLYLQDARIEKPEQIFFYSARLRPNWFVNTDCKKFVFTACYWEKSDGDEIDVKSEIENLNERRIDNPHKILAKACWQLADNHEESKSFPKASLFRQMANESKRLEDYKGWKVWSWHWWYWLSSFYGESPLRAGLVLVGILLLFAGAFMFSDFQVCPIVKTIPETACQARTLNIWESALQSLATATFQNIEYIKPNSKATTFLIILEKILAPLQAALLALAIRRKFMR